MPRAAESPPADLRARLPRWRPARAERAPLSLDGRSYQVTRLARSGARVALVCEPPPGYPVPPYPVRVRLLSRLEALHPLPLAVFTDAARSVEVWCWRAAGGAHRERFLWPGGRESLRCCALGAEGERPPRSWGGEPGSPGHAIPLAVLGRGRGRLLPDGVDPGALLRERLADTRGPSTVRRLWRRALALRVLDPACGRGEWLAGAMEVLARVYHDLLEQMEIWVGEAALGRDRRRPEHLRDFRAALSRAGETPAARDAFIRRTILLRNLYGAERDGRALAACRKRLLARLDEHAAPIAAARIVACDARRVLAARRADGEEMEAIARAERLLGAQWLAGTLEAASLGAGVHVLQRRLALLPAGPPWRGGFHLVRGRDG